MSNYLVIARKWRPQTFEDVVGQEHVVQTLRNAISLSRIAHSFIFSGPRGIGKTSVARILSKALNCENGPTPTPCGVCHNCREITEGISLDVHEIDGASNRGIDEVRELRENVKFLPVSSRYKVYIIDEVHMLTREAFNALLKTLEEPPPHVVFIFATTETQKIPATIMSRCQCFDFHRISLKQIALNLRKIADAEGIRISDAGLAWIAEAGDGSMRDSQSIFDQVISYAGLDIKDQEIEEILGRTDRRFLFQTSAAVLVGDAARCLTIIDEAYYAGLDMQSFYQMLLQHFRNLLLFKIVNKNEEILQVGEEDLLKLQEQAADRSLDTLQRLLDMLMEAEDNLRRSRHPRLNLEATLVSMAYLEPLIPLDQIVSRMEGLERRLSPELPVRDPGPKPVTQTTPYKRAAVPGDHSLPVSETTGSSYGTSPAASFQKKEDISTAAPPSGTYPLPENLESLWNDFKAYVKKNSPPLWSKIEPGTILTFESKLLRVGFPKNHYDLFLSVMDAAQKDHLNAQARSFLNDEQVTIKIEPLEGEKEGNGRNLNGPAKNSQHLENKREVMNHPAVQKILDVFEGAEVKEVLSRRKAGGD